MNTIGHLKFETCLTYQLQSFNRWFNRFIDRSFDNQLSTQSKNSEMGEDDACYKKFNEWFLTMTKRNLRTVVNFASSWLMREEVSRDFADPIINIVPRLLSSTKLDEERTASLFCLNHFIPDDQWVEYCFLFFYPEDLNDAEKIEFLRPKFETLVQTFPQDGRKEILAWI